MTTTANGNGKDKRQQQRQNGKFLWIATEFFQKFFAMTTTAKAKTKKTANNNRK